MTTTPTHTTERLTATLITEGHYQSQLGWAALAGAALLALTGFPTNVTQPAAVLAIATWAYKRLAVRAHDSWQHGSLAQHLACGRCHQPPIRGLDAP